MSSVASRDWPSSPLKDDVALLAICETVVLPNMQLLRSDIELFWEDPREYLCRDLEGADQETRRRASIDLVVALRREHHARVSAIIIAHVSRLLEQAKVVAEEQEVLCKDACVHMVIALGGSVSANSAPDLSVLEGFFSALVAPELNSEPTPSRALLRAACLKYVTVFRSRLPVASVVGILPGILRHALAESPVVHTAAVHCFSGLIPLQESTKTGSSPPQRRRRFDAEVLRTFALQLVQPVLQTLLEGRGIPQNEHLAHALVVMFDFLELRSEGLAEAATASLGMLAQLVGRAPGPANPEYLHDLFECVAIVLKGVAPSKAEEAEAVILPLLGQIWERRDEDSMSYCFQILGLLLDLTPIERVKAFHGEIFQKILGEELWRAPGYVPALVRLLRAHFVKHQVLGEMIRGHMQVVFQRFQFAMVHRKLKSSALGLLSAIFRYLPLDFYQQYLQVAISLVLGELQTKKEPYLEKECAVTLSIFINCQQDPGILPQVLDLIQPGLFQQFLTEIFLPGTSRVLLLQRRKICVLGLAKLMSSGDVCKNERLLLACCESLTGMLRSRNGGGLLCWLSALLSMAQEDEPVPGQEFEVSFRRLRHTELAPGGGLWDPLPEIQDTAAIMSAVRAALAPLQPAILGLGDGTKPLVELLQRPVDA
jgi:exportin-2 (importin alpha re-exporter)